MLLLLLLDGVDRRGEEESTKRVELNTSRRTLASRRRAQKSLGISPNPAMLLHPTRKLCLCDQKLLLLHFLLLLLKSEPTTQLKPCRDDDDQEYIKILNTERCFLQSYLPFLFICCSPAKKCTGDGVSMRAGERVPN